MKFKFPLMLILIASVLLFNPGCKDDKDDDPAPAPPTSVLCDGKGSVSFMPMALNNKWTLNTVGNTYSITVIDTQTIGNVKYFNVESNLGGAIAYSRYPNGDVKIYEFSSGDDVMYVPINPIVGQTWDFDVEFCTSRKIVSTNATVTTAACTYTGCLMIQSYSGATLKRTEYFKRGVGLISTDIIATGTVTKLSSVKLN